MVDGSVILGILAIGAGLAFIGLLIVAIARPIASHLPRPLVTEYVPPPGSVVEHGLLLRADRRVVAAALVDLAVRKQIRILAPRGSRGPVAVSPAPGASLSTEERMLLDALRPAALRPRQERRLLRALATIDVHVDSVAAAPDIAFLRGGGAFRRTQRRQLTAFLTAERDRLGTEGLTRSRPSSAHLILLSLLFLATLLVGAFLALGAVLEGEWVGAVAVLLVIAAVFGVLMLAPPPITRFSDRGRDLRRHLAGLREYIRLGEQRRLAALESVAGALRTGAGAPTAGGLALGVAQAPASDDLVAQSQLDRYVLLERLVPYAILFRQERSWQRELEHLGDLDAAENLRVLGGTFEGIMAVLEVLVIIGQIFRVIGGVASLIGRIGN